MECLVGGWFGEQVSSSDCWGHPQAGGPPGPCSNRVIRRYFPALYAFSKTETKEDAIY